MTVNTYFQRGVPMGRFSEQNLVEDLIIECLQIYGFSTYYLPRKEVNRDLILNEDPLNRFENAYDLEMYLESVNGFEGEGQLLTKFGLEIRDTLTFMVSRKRWRDVVGATGNSVLADRPAEGDVIYFPITKSFFEIRRVQVVDPFFQIGKLYTFRLECELMQFSSEEFRTNVTAIDPKAINISLDTLEQGMQVEETGLQLLDEEAEPVVFEEFDIEYADPIAQNNIFANVVTQEDILDFSETNPFGEVV